MSAVYTSVPLDEDSSASPRSRKPSTPWQVAKLTLLVTLPAAVFFGLGLVIGQGSMGLLVTPNPTPAAGGLLPPEAFVGEIPTKAVPFRFPTEYEDVGPDGDELWNNLLPDGAGFIRVPSPRRFDIPASEPIADDPEEGEVYSLSVTHQLHCLAVLRDVIKKYEKQDKSRFAGGGHEYHCLDYVRQAIMCAGDTTLDFADDLTFGPDGNVTRYGFTGARSVHQCRDWNVIKAFAEKHKSGDRKGILV